MKLISDEYRELNRKLHNSRKDYGANSKKWANTVLDIIKSTGVETILDYGCGKSSLGKQLPLMKITGYDPAVEGLDQEPEPHDLVVCTDVLEHIEPEYLTNVLDHIRSLSKAMVFLSVATRPAVKTLEDGRNAHLIVEDYKFWLPKLWERFNMVQFNNMGGQEFVFIGEAHEPEN